MIKICTEHWFVYRTQYVLKKDWLSNFITIGTYLLIGWHAEHFPQQMRTATVGRRVHRVRNQFVRFFLIELYQIALFDLLLIMAVRVAVGTLVELYFFKHFFRMRRTDRRRMILVVVPAPTSDRSGHHGMAVMVDGHTGRHQQVVGRVVSADRRPNRRAVSVLYVTIGFGRIHIFPGNNNYDKIHIKPTRQ